MRSRKAISPVIATVIIVAVAIAISIAVAGWLFGLWGGFAGGTPQISVTNPTGSASGQYIQVYITNDGSGSDELLQVDIIYGDQVYTIGSGTNAIEWPAGSTATAPPITIEANSEGWMKIDFSGAGFAGSVSPGDQLQVKLYFKESSTQQFPVTLGP
ncbi:MAG: type IV pilin [Desulfurococcales archaeon]|nr:type IV pilin [Desulfurococcales archaeon]